MSSFIYSAGLNNVGSYQVSGAPFATGSIDVDNSTPVKVEFPFVTRWVQIVAHTGSADDLRIGFSENGVQGTNYFRMHVNNNSNQVVAYDDPLPLKVTELWFLADSSGTANFDVVAGLTNLPAQRVNNLSGSDSIVGNNWSGSVGVG